MTVYDDPKQIADILRSAVQSSEEFGRSVCEVSAIVLEHAARYLDQLGDTDEAPEAEDCADSESKTGLGIDSHRYIFHPWRKSITQCGLCVSAVVSGNEEGHARFHVDSGEFPNVTARTRSRSTEVWAHKTATGWVMKTIHRGET